MKRQLFTFIALFLGLQLPVQAQVIVKDAWARATVAQQNATGIFFQIQSQKDGNIVGVKSNVADMAELHEMSMTNNIMKMREIESIALPAGKLVELKPGSFHIMLMQLKNQVKVGDVISLTLTIETADKKRETIEVKAKARAMMPQTHAH